MIYFTLHITIKGKSTNKELNMSKKMLAPIAITKAQQSWLEAEKVRTGEPTSTIVRSLIQDQIQKEADKKRA